MTMGSAIVRKMKKSMVSYSVRRDTKKCDVRKGKVLELYPAICFFAHWCWKNDLHVFFMICWVSALGGSTDEILLSLNFSHVIACDKGLELPSFFQN